MRVLLLLCALLPLPAAADPVVIDPEPLLDLAERPWSDRDAVIETLGEALGGFAEDFVAVPDELTEDDPLLWSISGTFGAPLEGSSLPGGIVICARYGLASRDRLAETGLTDRGAFQLFGLTLAGSDDAEVWPEAAIARLACMITWDDTRRVEILPEEPATAALSARFGELSRRGDREILGENWQRYEALYGEDGFLLEATDGPESSVMVVESAEIELRVSHQRFAFRSFLMGGGV
ncbi:hypothetical protein HKCCE3408_05535 [Rhodobacterales bacterium HKCCE3408]|nr:hypothetical protein [Rhodobacterales bacterium HKCCE3408]